MIILLLLDFLAYTADVGTTKVDYLRTFNYTFARSRDRTLRTIENVRTDGTVALVDNVPKTTRNLYAAGNLFY